MFRVRVKEPLINIKNMLNSLFYKCVIFSLFICCSYAILLMWCYSSSHVGVVVFFSMLLFLSVVVFFSCGGVFSHGVVVHIAWCCCSYHIGVATCITWCCYSSHISAIALFT